MLKWFSWLVLLAFVVVLLLRRSTRKSLLPLQKELADATNALLTEHYLAAHDLAAVSPFSKELADSVCGVCRASGFPNATEELVARQFNRHNRFTQLNVIAMALHHDGTEPPHRANTGGHHETRFRWKEIRGALAQCQPGYFVITASKLTLARVLCGLLTGIS